MSPDHRQVEAFSRPLLHGEVLLVVAKQEQEARVLAERSGFQLLYRTTLLKGHPCVADVLSDGVLAFLHFPVGILAHGLFRGEQNHAVCVGMNKKIAGKPTLTHVPDQPA